MIARDSERKQIRMRRTLVKRPWETIQTPGSLAILMAFASVIGVVLFDHAQASPIIYPAQGQSDTQQQQDETECRGWAQNETGFDPSRGAPVVYGQPTGGEGLRGAAGGAALGAIGGAIGGSAGKGAAIGAGVGGAAGLLNRGRKENQNQQSQQQATAQYNQRVAEYNRAFSICMKGRGYTVG